MKKTLFLVTIFLLFNRLTLSAQVGINTTDPKSTLDIAASDIDFPSNIDGILIPRLDQFPAINPGPDQDSMLVFLNQDLVSVNISGTAQDFASGFYFWDNDVNNWIAFGAGGWRIDGNDDINDTVNFLGTTNEQSLAFRVENNKVGELNHNGAVSFGFNTDNSSEDSVAIGTNAATPNIESIALGLNSRAAQEGAIAIGTLSNASNEDGIAIGDGSRAQAQRNVAIGNEANTQNVDAVGIGSSANAISQSAIAIGTDSHVQGIRGIAIGDESTANSQGSIALGPDSFAQNNNALAIGSNASANHQNAIALGRNAQTTNSSQLRLGSINQLDLNGASIVNASDKRFKYEVRENIPGLSFITKLRPVSYKFDYAGLDVFTKNDAIRANTEKVESGLIAQEVEKAMEATGYDFDGLTIPENVNNDIYKVSYVKLVVPLIQAVKEQQEQIESLQNQLSELEVLKQQMLTLKAQIESINN